MALLPRVVQAEYRGGYSIHLVFSDGRQATVDFDKWLDGPAFR
jgi:hypothetical protein